MTIYEVYDNYVHGNEGRYYRNLKEAKADFTGVTTGYLAKITIRTPIKKDMIINILNKENYEVSREELIVR